jgi:hypothetical protein
MIAWMWGLCILASLVSAVAGAETLLASFPSLPDGAACKSVAVPVDGPTVLVTVVSPGANPMQPSLRMGDRNIPAQSVGHDSVTRLGFLQINGPAVSSPPGWLDDARGSVGTPGPGVTKPPTQPNARMAELVDALD